jgi:transposase
MFFRDVKSGGHRYVKLVENYRVPGKKTPSQRVLLNIGRLENLVGTGLIERFLSSGAKYAERAIVLTECNKDTMVPEETLSIGPGLVFGRIWEELGFPAVINRCLTDTNFEIPVERVIFMSVVHRLVETGSDRSAIKWLAHQRLEGCGGIELHHCYRSMTWLGKPIDNLDNVVDYEAIPPLGSSTELPKEYDLGTDQPVVGVSFDDSNSEIDQPVEASSEKSKSQKEKTPKLASSIRRTKDLLEERIYQKRSTLLTPTRPVFFDTTSIYFEGEGGTLGQRGHTKDHRPDLKQVVVGLVIDEDKLPICTEIWDGNTADVTTLIPISERLHKRFNIKKVCMVADRGMISQYTLDHLKNIGWSYILGAKMRNTKEVKTVLADDGPFFEVTPEREHTHDPAPLKVKEVFVNNNRYIVCLNDEEASKDKHVRVNILENLKVALKKGDKTLIGNKGYKRFLKTGLDTFSIDFEKALEDEKYDGKFVLKTDIKIPADEVAFQYKQLLNIESMFRKAKSLFNTRPIHHSKDENIVGHIWCSFLAFLLQKVLMDAIEKKSKPGKIPLEWADIVNHLDWLTMSKYKCQEKEVFIRSDILPGATAAFQALGVRIPNVVDMNQVENVVKDEDK